MKREMVMRKVGGALRPDGDQSWEVFERLKSDTPLIVSVRQTRNADHLKKYWAIAAKVADFDKGFDDREDADHWVRMGIPWMRKEYRLGDGRVSVRPISIAIDAMSQEEFDRFYERAIELWSQRIGCDPETLLNEVRSAHSRPRPSSITY